MIPTTAQATLTLAVIAFACWGTWAVAFKMAGPKWRFEHFYFDFAFGAMAASLIAGFTFGSSGTDLTLADAFLISSRKQWALAAAAGAVFNLGNMLLLAAVEIRGMAIAFPLAMATAGTVAAVRILVTSRGDNPALLLAGAALLAASIVLAAMAAGRLSAPPAAGAGNRKTIRQEGAAKPVTLAILGGLLFGLSEWPLRSARQGLGDLSLGPYALALLFCLGIVLTTVIYNLYFLNLPVHGEPAGFGPYFQGRTGTHLLGVFGGAIFAGGLLGAFVVAEAEGGAALAGGIREILVLASAILAALWGLLAFGEFRQARQGGFLFALLALLSLAGGLAALAIRIGI